MKPRSETPMKSAEWQIFKWSLMSSAVLWALVYKFSERGLKIPDFVYVNF